MKNKSSFSYIFEIVTMSLAYLITRGLQIAKWVSLFMFVFSCAMFTSHGKQAILFLVIISMGVYYVARFIKDYEYIKFLLFLIVIILSCVGFLVYSWKCVFSEYSYLFLICIGSWLLETVMGKIGYRYTTSMLDEYKRIHKEKEDKN